MMRRRLPQRQRRQRQQPRTPAAAAEAPAAASQPGVTSFYGDTSPASPQAWAAEAAMNPDYAAAPAAAPAVAETAGEPATAAEAATAPDAAPAPAAEAAPAAAEEAPPMTPPGTTAFYGETAPASPPAWVAEAAMNPDYDASAPAPAAAPEAAPAAAVEEALPMTPPGTTSFYGDTAPASPPAWAAEATMNSGGGAAASPAAQAAVEACRDALNAEARAGKINFAMSSWDVSADSFKTLDKIAKIAKACDSAFVIEVGGHTDNTGKAASNKTISEFRAQSVVKYLTKAGVATAKLKAVGHGQDKPVADNASVEGRRQNRRIDFLVTSN